MPWVWCSPLALWPAPVISARVPGTGARLLGPCVALTALKPQLEISDDQRAVSPVARAPELNRERALSPPADLVFGGVFDRARFRLWAAALGEF